jgi:hypothetical protein
LGLTTCCFVCVWYLTVHAVPLEFFTPVSSSIGVQLLQKMGWRQGKGIGSKGASTAAARKPRQRPSHPGLDGALYGGLAELAGFRGPSAAAGSDSDGDEQQQHTGNSKWGTVAGVSIENTPLYVLDPKQDLHGLGFDPFEGAEEFRSRKRQKLDAARAATGGMSQPGESGFGGSGRGRGAGAGKARGIAFGTGALEESDTLGYMEDYIDADADVIANKGKRNEMFAFEEATESGERVGWAIQLVVCQQKSCSYSPVAECLTWSAISKTQVPQPGCRHRNQGVCVCGGGGRRAGLDALQRLSWLVFQRARQVEACSRQTCSSTGLPWQGEPPLCRDMEILRTAWHRQAK